MFDFFELCLALAWFALPAILATAGLHQISVGYWSRVESRRSAETYRADLYRVAQYVGLHRAKNCGCPMCGDSYGDRFLTDWSNDVG